jgi:hypothetical protein
MNFQEIATDLAVPKRKNAVIAAVIVVLVITIKMLYGGDSSTFGSNGRYGPIVKGWQLGPMSVEEFMAIAIENGMDYFYFSVGEGDVNHFDLRKTDDGWDIASEKGIFSESFSGADLSFDDIADIFEREAEKHPSALVLTGYAGQTELSKKYGSFRLIKIRLSREEILGKGDNLSTREFAQAVLNEFGLDELETNGNWYYSTNDNARGWKVSVDNFFVTVSEVERANFN